MQSVLPAPAAVHESAFRKPTAMDVVAGALLLATVVLHIVAMFPGYFDGTDHASLISQTDQAALYSVLAAAWAATLVIGFMGPSRMPVCAAAAVGIAATELGFRVTDFGTIWRYSTSQAGPGLWIMGAAWVVGALAAVAATTAALRRPKRLAGLAGSATTAATTTMGSASDSQSGPRAEDDNWAVDWPPPPVELDPPASDNAAADDSTTQLAAVSPGDATQAIAVPDATRTTEVVDPTLVPRSGDTVLLDAVPDDVAGSRTAWTAVVVVLAIGVAGAFLPAWDHYVAQASATGRSASFNLGDAFQKGTPWQIALGSALAAAALLVVPVVAIRLRNRAAGAALAIGSLAVLATQFISAVVQVDQPVPPSIVGDTPAQASQLGLTVNLRLTGWFTLDALAAFALFAAFMVWSTVRLAQENSAETAPSAPDFRRESMPWVS